jgi:hypothetical protein
LTNFRLLGGCLPQVVFLWKITYISYLHKLPNISVMYLFWRKMDWATFWATFSQTHPQGWNLSPMGNVHPFAHPRPRGEHSLQFIRIVWRTENFAPRG